MIREVDDGIIYQIDDVLAVKSKLCMGKITEKGKLLQIYYIRFELEKLNEGSWVICTSNIDMDFRATSKRINDGKLMLIKYYLDNFYNYMLFQSNPAKPEVLYKAVSNVKGKEFALVPRFELI